ncbi:cation-efflux pump [Fundidesulfovibrio terrae]|uniref:cation-efflux pump n=1 Tax=Fundidesulfovibrio terrae TaxID=2922866 RepID=UPI001FAF9976|nr:cation-efflux pump [Fundidesulfovibrio terrae]
MHIDSHEAGKEKRGAAMSSLVAAVFLTSMKLAVGLSTNSLGILSEAAHSGLDLVAAAVTYFAVRYSSVPADTRHPYGHGKMENLSALVETLLLLLTCVYIVREAVNRLFYAPEAVEVTWWSFGVMAVSIVIDISRSRMLKRMAEKHNSQALEADALHFSTDIWSSAVVILGLGCVWIAQMLPVGSPWRSVLERADAVAALGVSAIVVWVSVRLGREAIDVLLDGGSQDMVDEIRSAVEDIQGVRGVGQVRARISGPSAFVDLILDISRHASFEEAHKIGARAEDAVKEILPGADVVVHLTPVAAQERDLFELVRGVAARQALGVHGLRAHQSPSGLHLEMHVEVPDGLSLARAHELVTQFEDEVRGVLKEPVTIASHIEPVGEADLARDNRVDHSEDVKRRVEHLVGTTDGVTDCHGVAVHRLGTKYAVSFHCRMDPSVSIGHAHEMTARLEDMVRAAVEDIGRVVIHVEPEEGAPASGYPAGGP